MQECKSLEPKFLRFNASQYPFRCSISKYRPLNRQTPPGGVLADEMGLGKTIEVLSLILTHRLRENVLPEALPIIIGADDKKTKVRHRKKQEVASLKGKESATVVSGHPGVHRTSTNEDHAYAEEDINDVIKCTTTSESDTSRIGDSFMEDINQQVAVESDDVSSDEAFECTCGENESLANKNRRLRIVQCVMCRVWQHAKCLNYDLSDPHRGKYFCPHCHVINPPIRSGATLIVTPESISYQWVDEILKHVHDNTLSVFVYKGVHQSGGYIQPQTLANQDLVITTYQVLCKELSHVDLPHSKSETGRRMRHRKRYMAKASPLVAVKWWRVCLDEAQMVEATTRRMAQMAMRLHAVNKWCVTGLSVSLQLNLKSHPSADFLNLIHFRNADSEEHRGCVRSSAIPRS